MGMFDKPIKDLKKEFEKARNVANNATNALNKAVKSAMDDIKKKVEKTADNSTKGIKKFHKELQKPLKGIDKLIKDFEDIVVTFNRSIPNRFTNVFAGIEVILKDGLGGEIKTLTDIRERIDSDGQDDFTKAQCESIGNNEEHFYTICSDHFGQIMFNYSTNEYTRTYHSGLLKFTDYILLGYGQCNQIDDIEILPGQIVG